MTVSLLTTRIHPSQVKSLHKQQTTQQEAYRSEEARASWVGAGVMWCFVREAVKSPLPAYGGVGSG